MLLATAPSRLPGEGAAVVAAIVAVSLGAPALLAAAVAGAGAIVRLRRRALGDRLVAQAIPAAVAFAAAAGPLSLLAPWLDDEAAIAAALGVAVLLGSGVVARWPVAGPVLLAAGAATLPWRTSLPERPPPAARAEGPLVVLITLDTFRADHLGAIGGWRRPIATPNLDAFAAGGVLFTHGVAEVPLTLPSHTAMLTGAPPWETGVVRNGDAVGRELATVADELHARGFATGAFVSASVLHGAGLERGFDHYDSRMSVWGMALDAALPGVLARAGVIAGRGHQRPGDATARRALAWLEGRDGATFLWVHLYDPHAPYAPPSPYDAMYDATAPDAPGHPDEVVRWRRQRARSGFSLDLVPRDLRRPIALYDGETSWTDDVVGRLLAALPDDARVVIAADHGESLTEHGYFLNHGTSVHEPSLRVPILARGPGVAAGTVIDTPTPLRRVAGTLRAFAGAPSTTPGLGDPPEAELVSFSPTQQSRPSLDPRQQIWRVALRRGPTKWIVDARGDVDRHDLLADPGELADVSDGDPDRDAVRDAGLAWIERLRAAEARSVADPDRATREALEALGYTD